MVSRRKRRCLWDTYRCNRTYYIGGLCRKHYREIEEEKVVESPAPFVVESPVPPVVSPVVSPVVKRRAIFNWKIDAANRKEKNNITSIYEKSKALLETYAPKNIFTSPKSRVLWPTYPVDVSYRFKLYDSYCKKMILVFAGDQKVEKRI